MPTAKEVSSQTAGSLGKCPALTAWKAAGKMKEKGVTYNKTPYLKLQDNLIGTRGYVSLMSSAFAAHTFPVSRETFSLKSHILFEHNF